MPHILNFIYGLMIDSVRNNVLEFDIDNALMFVVDICPANVTSKIKKALIVGKYIEEKEKRYYINKRVLEKDIRSLIRSLEKDEKAKQYIRAYKDCFNTYTESEEPKYDTTIIPIEGYMKGPEIMFDPRINRRR